VERAIDPTYLGYQYGTTERLRIRLEAHQRYSEHADDFFELGARSSRPAAG
jgi:hypothetical protein